MGEIYVGHETEAITEDAIAKCIQRLKRNA